MGLSGNPNEFVSNQFANMIERNVLENSTPVIYKKFKNDVKTRIWFSDVKLKITILINTFWIKSKSREY